MAVGGKARAVTLGLALLTASPLACAFDPLFVPAFGDRVIVKKSERRLYVYSEGKQIAEFKVSLGRAPVGPKRRVGDTRTPEGHYVLDARKPNSEFYRAFHVSYPNADDIREAARLGVETGGDIMIHGLPNWYHGDDRFFSWGDWTNGCIAVANRDMDLLWVMVAEGTPIDILP